jgi:TonB family protein
MFPRFWLSALLLASSLACIASTGNPIQKAGRLSDRERNAWQSPVHAAKFSAIPYVAVERRCQDTEMPQALTTPDPLFISPALPKVKVSVIVGTDGRVHSPLILESGGLAGDRNILQTVRAWRYRPATCNGVPTEAEGQIEFSRR